MSSYEISHFLKVFNPTERATSHPAILPSFNKDLLHFINFLQLYVSPASKAHYSELKNAYSLKFYVVTSKCSFYNLFSIF